MVLLCKANGRSSITENIFENRFMHVGELQRLGAKITVKDNKAIIEALDLEIGCQVEVIRAGKIIPQIIRRVDV